MSASKNDDNSQPLKLQLNFVVANWISLWLHEIIDLPSLQSIRVCGAFNIFWYTAFVTWWHNACGGKTQFPAVDFLKSLVNTVWSTSRLAWALRLNLQRSKSATKPLSLGLSKLVTDHFLVSAVNDELRKQIQSVHIENLSARRVLLSSMHYKDNKTILNGLIECWGRFYAVVVPVACQVLKATKTWLWKETDRLPLTSLQRLAERILTMPLVDLVDLLHIVSWLMDTVMVLRSIIGNDQTWVWQPLTAMDDFVTLLQQQANQVQ